YCGRTDARPSADHCRSSLPRSCMSRFPLLMTVYPAHVRGGGVGPAEGEQCGGEGVGGFVERLGGGCCSGAVALWVFAFVVAPLDRVLVPVSELIAGLSQCAGGFSDVADHRIDRRRVGHVSA